MWKSLNLTQKKYTVWPPDNARERLIMTVAINFVVKFLQLSTYQIKELKKPTAFSNDG